VLWIAAPQDKRGGKKEHADNGAGYRQMEEFSDELADELATDEGHESRQHSNLVRSGVLAFPVKLRPRPKTIASGRVSRCDGVVPFWMEGVASYVEGRHLLVGDFYTFRIVGIEFAAGRQTGFRRGVRDQCDGDEHAGERRSTPSLGYVAEHAMLDLVPLRRPRRIMADL